MYHLLKGLHEYLTRSESRSRLPARSCSHALAHRKDEFSVIIIGLDGAGKTVRMANFYWPAPAQTELNSRVFAGIADSPREDQDYV